MTDWLVLPDGQRLDMDQAEEVTTKGDRRSAAQDVRVHMCDGTIIELGGQNAAAVRAWLQTRGCRRRR